MKNKQTLDDLKKYESCKTCSYGNNSAGSCLVEEPLCVINPDLRKKVTLMRDFTSCNGALWAGFLKGMEVTDE